MDDTDRAPLTTVAAGVIVTAGVVIAIVGVFVAGVGTLCSTTRNACTATDHALRIAGLTAAGIGLTVLPAVAVRGTRQWRWVAVPASAVVLVAGYAGWSRLRRTEDDSPAVQAQARAVAQSVDVVAGLPLAPPAPAGDARSRALAARRRQEAELARVIAARRELAAVGLSVGRVAGPGMVEIASSGAWFCYRVPTTSPAGTATPGHC